MSTKNMPRGFKIATGNNKRPRWREGERQQKAVIEKRNPTSHSERTD